MTEHLALLMFVMLSAADFEFFCSFSLSIHASVNLDGRKLKEDCETQFARNHLKLLFIDSSWYCFWFDSYWLTHETFSYSLFKLPGHLPMLSNGLLSPRLVGAVGATNDVRSSYSWWWPTMMWIWTGVSRLHAQSFSQWPVLLLWFFLKNKPYHYHYQLAKLKCYKNNK